MTDEVRYYKLSTGDEILGRFVEEDDETVTLGYVRSLLAQPTQDGVQIGFLPWMFGAPDGTIDIKKSSIMGDPEKLSMEIENAYLQQTSGIEFASASSASGLHVPE